MSYEKYENGGFYEQSVPMGEAAPIEPFVPGTIERCAGCSNIEQASSLGVMGLFDERPWWHWLALGGVVGAGIYMVNRSGILRNPEAPGAKLSDLQLAQQAAAISVQAGEPTILWGKPGIGKTAWLNSLGDAMDAEVFTVIGSTKDPADIGGLMKLDGSLIAPSWAQDIAERSKQGKRSLLFLDEFSSMSPLVHAALLRVVREKIAGELELDPENKYVFVVAAANPSSEGAGSVDLPPPAANRMIHIKWKKPMGMLWGIGLSLGFAKPAIKRLPDNWRESYHAQAAREAVFSFLKAREELFLKLPATETERGLAWPSPRSWEMAADVLGAARAAGASEDVQMILVKGAVGDGIAQEFEEFITEENLPNPEDLLKDPTKIVTRKGKILEWKDIRRDQYYAIDRGLSYAIAKDPTPERWLAVWDVIFTAMKLGGVTADAFFPVAQELLNEYPQIMMGTQAVPDEILEHFAPLAAKAGVLSEAGSYKKEGKSAVRVGKKGVRVGKKGVRIGKPKK